VSKKGLKNASVHRKVFKGVSLFYYCFSSEVVEMQKACVENPHIDADKIRELCKALEEGGIKRPDELLAFSKSVGRLSK
jgi:hypothetical protein